MYSQRAGTEEHVQQKKVKFKKKTKKKPLLSIPYLLLSYYYEIPIAVPTYAQPDVSVGCFPFLGGAIAEGMFS